MTVAYVAFGGNVGDPRSMYRAVADALQAAPDVHSVRCSRLVHSQPVGGPPGQGVYLNGCLEVETSLTALELFALLRVLESTNGRRRTGHWGPRTLDLDLALFGAETVDSPDLAVPHPRMHYRRFVLAPLAELNQEILHPVLGKTAPELLKTLDVVSATRDATLAIVGCGLDEVQWLTREFSGEETLRFSTLDAGALGPVQIGGSIVGVRAAETVGASLALLFAVPTGRPNPVSVEGTVLLPAVDCRSVRSTTVRANVQFFFESIRSVAADQ